MMLLCVLLLPGAAIGIRTQVQQAEWLPKYTGGGMAVLPPEGLRQAAMADCQVDHTADMTKPMEQVISENPGVDMMCYFQKASQIYAETPGNDPGVKFWVNPIPQHFGSYTDFAQKGVDYMKTDPITCNGGWKGDGKGPLATIHYDGGTISTHLDCEYYGYDDFYFYSLGWLRGQGGLDGSLLANNTAWEQQAAKECEKIGQEIQATPEETTLLFNAQQNGVIASKASCALKEDCPAPITVREFKLHVYTKCLMGGGRTIGHETAYAYLRACLLKGNMIGHGVECENVPA